MSFKTLLSKAVCRTFASAQDLLAGVSGFPRLVRIETTNACNAKCAICPHQFMKRAIQHMDDGLFQGIVDECAKEGCKQIHLHNFGEPLIDKKLSDRVRYAKRRGIAKVKIFCNGSLLLPDRARRLIEAGLDEIKISFDGATKEEFEEIRQPLKFDKVVRNIEEVVRLRNEMNGVMKINVACVSTSDKSSTMAMLESMVDGFSFGKVHNWGDHDYASVKAQIRKPCSRVWRTFTILANGDVSLCCLDYDGQVILGHVDDDTSIRDIYHGAAYREIRAKHARARQDEIPLCRSCTKSFLFNTPDDTKTKVAPKQQKKRRRAA